MPPAAFVMTPRVDVGDPRGVMGTQIFPLGERDSLTTMLGASIVVPGTTSRPQVRAPELTPGDAALLLAVAGHDHEALLTLYDRYSGAAYGLAYQILQESGAAEEVVQDAYLRVWHRAATFDPSRGHVRPWLLTIVHHCAIDLVRRRGRTAPVLLNFDELIDRHAVSDTWLEVAHCDEQARVRTAVASLPPAQRRAIELAFFEGLTHREIALREDVPLGTVKGRMRLGLQRLAHLLADPD